MTLLSSYKTCKDLLLLSILLNSSLTIFFFKESGTRKTKTFNLNPLMGKSTSSHPEVFYKKMCSYKLCKIQRKTLLLESLFNKAAGPQNFNFILKMLQQICLPVNVANFLRILFSQNTFGDCFCRFTHKRDQMKSSSFPCATFFKKVNSQKQPPEVFCKKGVLRNFAKFTGKYLCQSLFFNKVAGLRPATFLKKRL